PRNELPARGRQHLGSQPSSPFIAFVDWRFCFIIPPMKPCRSLMASIAFACSLPLRLLAAEPEVTEQDLPRVPPTEPNKAIDTFQIKSGFRIELVAAEPLVVDPISMAFEEDSWWFVVEM